MYYKPEPHSIINLSTCSRIEIDDTFHPSAFNPKVHEHKLDPPLQIGENRYHVIVYHGESSYYIFTSKDEKKRNHFWYWLQKVLVDRRVYDYDNWEHDYELDNNLRTEPEL